MREIELRLEVIANLAEDDRQAATVEQTKLYEDFIAYVTTLEIEGPLPEKARKVLSAREIKFKRKL